MKRINDHTGFFEGDSERVHSILDKWQPKSFGRDETAYEEELYAALRLALPDVPMAPQQGLARGRADIVIEDSHVIELKVRLVDGNEFDRCIGQLERYRQRWVKKDRGPVYLVVVGESDPDLRDLLHTWFKDTNDQFLTWSPFHLIEKLPALSATTPPTLAAAHF
jgi:hypothetical protein